MTLPVAQTRRLFEERFRDIENQIRTLVADLAEDIWTDGRGVDGMKQFIHQHGAEVAEGANTANASSIERKPDQHKLIIKP
jgi:hypothetical protein